MKIDMIEFISFLNHCYLGDFVKLPEIEFEKADTSELDEILPIVNVLNREMWIKIIPKEHYIEPFLTKEQITQMSTFMDFYVLRQEEEIIAVGSFAAKDENTAWIPLMYVKSAFQRKGIGSALMFYFEKMANKLEFKKMTIETDSHAEWAMNFYKKHGYSTVKKDENPWGYHVWLEKQLTDE